MSAARQPIHVRRDFIACDPEAGHCGIGKAGLSRAIVLTEHVLPQSMATLVRLERRGRILDIAGGLAVVHYAKRFPQAEIVGLEHDASRVALARTILAESGFGPRVEIREGDAAQLEEEGVYDLVTIMGDGKALGWRDALHRVRRALKPGGTVIVSGWRSPYVPELGEFTSPGRFCRWLKRTNFENVRLAEPPADFAALAEKPGACLDPDRLCL